MKLLTTKSVITFLLSIFLVAVMFDAASANDNVAEKGKKAVVSTVKTEKTKKGKSSKIQEKAALQKIANATAKKNIKTNKPSIKQKKIKQDNSESVLSFNFIFYLVYEFKFSDIINFDEGGESQNTIDRPFEDILFDKGKSLFNWLISTISY